MHDAERGHGHKLQRGSPDGPDLPDGCLVDVVSQLAGEPWADHPPSCVHPTLGAIARVVQEHSSDAGRLELRTFAPELIGTARPGFEAPARLVAVCVSTALASPYQQRITTDEMRRLAAAHQTALYLLKGRVQTGDDDPAGGEPRLRGAARWWMPTLGLVGLGETFYRFVATEHAAKAVAVTARASGSGGDLRLRQLLRMCIAVSPPGDSVPTSRGTEGREAAQHRGDG